MKRLLLTTFIIGAAVAAVVSVLHASGLTLRFELAATELVSHRASATRIVSDKWQYLVGLVIGIGVAWLTLISKARRGSRLLVLFLVIDLLGLSWVCSLYRIFFQPFPSISFPSSRWQRRKDGLSF